MERIRVTLDDGTLVLGVPEPGVLSAIITAVTRIDPPPGLTGHGCDLSLGGLHSATSDYVTWPGCDLEAGDRIEIEVLPEGSADEPESSSKIESLLQKEKEKQEARNPQEEERVRVRRAAKMLGWTLIEGAAGVALQADDGPAAALQAAAMERFRVTVRGQSHTIGLPGPGVLSVILSVVVRSDPDTGRDHECRLKLGGLDSATDTHIDWPEYDLRAGDLVVVEILPEGPSDEPVARRSEKEIAAAYYENRRDEYRQRAQALGWTVIEGDTPQHP